MAKMLCICSRSGATYPPRLDAVIDRLNARLTPDNIDARAPSLAEAPGIATVVFNPNPSIRRHGASVCLGAMIDAAPDWWSPGAAVPDGTYVLVRCGEDAIEIVNDPVASRTLWYVLTDELFIVSTSQRAIVSLLGSFHPNAGTYPWMLSCGQLGPDQSWDRRISMLRPQSRLVLDRASWRVENAASSTDINPVDLSRAEHTANLERIIRHTFDALDLDLKRWVLPLSGGADSRAILLLLQERERLRCVTWGLRAAQNEPGNDAYVARQLAETLGLDHRFFETDVSTEPIDVLFDRYLVAGEGRVDSVGGYMDGFKIWKDLFETGADGVLRGDECFGMRLPVYTAFGVRRYINCLLLSDYANLTPALTDGLPDQSLPAYLARRDGEPIVRWRDRLYQNFRMPFVMAALNELKCAYVEVVNPFLSRGIIDYTRTIPDSLRLGKSKPFLDIVRGMGPDIPYAARPAIDTHTNILTSPGLVDLVVDEIDSSDGRSLLPGNLTAYLKNSVVKRAPGAPRHATPLRMDLPSNPLRGLIEAAIRRPRAIAGDRFRKLVLDPNVMAFRAFLIVRMHRTLKDDAESLGL